MKQSVLLSRLNDAAERAENKGIPAFIGFLRTEEKYELATAAERMGLKHLLFGGTDDCERVYIGVFPEWCEPEGSLFPITAVGLTYRRLDTPSHSDILGALMGLGIERDSVGDILIGEGKALVFLSSAISGYVINELSRVGRIGVTAAECEPDFVERHTGFEDLNGTVASARADCVAAEIFRTSRNDASRLINEGLVIINGFPCKKADAAVKPGDRLSLKGKGKFIIDDLSTVTKKGRLVLKYKKYI